MAVETARIVEIFSSIQGEGPLVGVRQIFVRFFGCNVRCIYCDTPESLKAPETCLVESHPGACEFQKISNPVSAAELEEILRGFQIVPHHSVSLTGGEPLLHAPFLRLFLPRIKSLGLNTYLETNGILSSQLESVLEWIDTISMDIKLPSTLEPLHDFFPEHEEFLRLATRKKVFVKVVVLPDVADSEIVRAAKLVESVSSSVPLVLQPVSEGGKVNECPSPDRLLHLHSVASRVHPDVRVIPQVHKLSGLL
jgi:organic radical activating enzyme